MGRARRAAKPRGRDNTKTGKAKDSQRRRITRDLLGYEALLSGGVAALGGDEWSLTMRLADINYEIESTEHQARLVEQWAKFLNSFGGRTRIQITCRNRVLDRGTILAGIGMRPRGDRFDPLRAETNRIMAAKLEGLSSNCVTDKYLTVTVSEEPGRAVATLNRTAKVAAGHLAPMDGCALEPLSRADRIRLLASVTRPGADVPVDERAIAEGRISSKDLIAPWRVDASDPRHLAVSGPDGDVFRRTLWVRDFPAVMGDRLIADLMAVKADVTVSIHLTPYDRAEGEALVGRAIAEMDMQRLEERRRNIRQKLPVDDVSSDLMDGLEQAGELRDEMRRSNERLVDAIVLVSVAAGSRDELERLCRETTAAIRRNSCTAETLSYMQAEALNAVLPLGVNPLPMRRTLTTSGAAILTPFSMRELMQSTGVFYGANARSGSPVVVDRTLGSNANGFILGSTGSGKSQAAKAEMTALFLSRTADDILVIDPEREYASLCAALGGARVAVGAGSRDRINPLDLNPDGSDGDPVREKTGVAVAMIGALIGGSDGLDAAERSILDRCLLALYRGMRNHPGSPQPTLMDLHASLAACPEPEARNLAVGLEAYALGSLAGFAGPTTVDTSNRMTVFDVSGLEGEIRTFGMMAVLDHIWNRVVRNYRAGRRTWVVVDEFHRMFSNPYASTQFLDMYKRARKWGLAMTGVTQNVEELLAHPQARLMLANSDFLLLMNQAPTDASSLAALWDLSPELAQRLESSRPGEGVLKSGTCFVPLDARIARDGALYRLYTTKFEERNLTCPPPPPPPPVV